MANKEHLNLLKEGIGAWNRWIWAQKETPRPDLSGADLQGIDLRNYYLFQANFQGANLQSSNFRGVDLRFANFQNANLNKADLQWATLYKANLSHAKLMDAKLQGTDFRKANMTGVNLHRAYLRDANLREACLHEADLSCAELSHAVLVETDLCKATLSNSRIYGISAWNPNLSETIQEDLIITPQDEAVVTVDDLEIAQFVYLLLDNKKIRDVIDTVTSKAVLILGRFTPERKIVLDTLRTELRNKDHLPILFDFEKPASKNLTETVATLANLARFVIADLTDPKSIPQELQRIIPHNPSLPIQPIILVSQDPYAMFGDLLDYPWVMPPYRYESLETLIANIADKIVEPVTQKASQIEARRRSILQDLG